MSDSIPTIIHVLSENNLTSRFGNEIGSFLAVPGENKKLDVPSREAHWKAISDSERRLEASSRSGTLISALGELIKKAGLNRLDFLSSKTYTHKIVSTAYGMREVFHFSVINTDFDRIVENIASLIEWSRENADAIPEELLWDYGTDRDGRDFDSKLEAIDKVLPSLKPNDDVCDAESCSLALAFSVLKTLQELLTYAKSMGYWVIIEHWGGLENS